MKHTDSKLSLRKNGVWSVPFATTSDICILKRKWQPWQILLAVVFSFIFSATSSAQIITTYAGNTSRGCTDGVPATAAHTLLDPSAVVFDASGNLYIADLGTQTVKKVNTAGNIFTIAGICTTFGFTGDGGPATAARFSNPYGIAVDKNNNIFIGDQVNHRIRKITASGIITTYAGDGSSGSGGDGGPATAAQINDPFLLAVDTAGNLYMADNLAHRIRKISTSGIITTIAGTGSSGYGGDGGAATAAQLSFPFGVFVDLGNNVFISDNGNNRIRKISPSGIISTIAGDGTASYSGDGGPSTAAKITAPAGITGDASGNLYITENNYDVRKIDASGIISTIAGTYGTPGYSGDGAPATAALFSGAVSIALDNSNNIYIGDIMEGVVRRISALPLPSITGVTFVCLGSTSTLMNAVAGGTWSSSNTVIATAGSSTGIITGVSTGTVIITYTASAGLATKVMTVVAAAASITGTTTVCAGLTTTLADATSGGTWTSSNTSVATIGSPTGIVTGVSSGTSTISYTISGGCLATKVVTVNTVAAITGTVLVADGATTTLSNATTGGMWSSSNTSVASVASSSGVVTGISTGSAVISYIMPSGCFVTTVITDTSAPAWSFGAPVVTSLSARSGIPSSPINLTGLNFNPTPARNIVYFGATRATVSSASSTLLSVTIPSGATFESISVDNTDTALTGYSPLPFLPTYDNSDYIPGTVNFRAKTEILSVGIGSTTGTASMQIKDIDNDGKPDIVILKNGETSVKVFQNVGSGGPITSSSFAAPISFRYAGSVPTANFSLTVGDIDGDGKPDIAVNSNQVTGDSVVILRNTSTPGTISSSSFAAPVQFILNTVYIDHPSQVKIADLNGDGRPEILALYRYRAISVLPNTSSFGTIRFGTPGTIAIDVLANPDDFAIGDIDGDGKPDLVVPNSSPSTAGLSVLRNTSSGGAISFASYVGFASVGYLGYEVRLADIDGDGKLDIISGASALNVYRNTSTVGVINSSSLAPSMVFTGVSWPFDVADIDGDGKPDILNAGNILRNTASAGVINSSSLSLTSNYISSAITPLRVSAGDLNGDGKPDIVVSGFTTTGSTDTLDIHENAPLLLRITGATTICNGGTSAFSDPVGGGVWTSSNTTVAGVGSGSGIVSGLTLGTSVITYTASSGYTTITVTVVSTPPAIAGTTSICAGMTTTLTSAAGGMWSSSNSSIASVGSASGVVTGVSAGTVIISFATSCGTVVATVTVYSVTPAITGSTSACTGTPLTLSNTAPGTWSSSNTSVAPINSVTGVISGSAGPGTATITFTSVCGIATTTVTMNISPPGIGGLSTICAAATTPLAAAPSGGAWSSSNPSIASVSGSGILSGVSAGTVNITYTTTSMCYFTRVFTVSASSPITGTTAVCTGAAVTLSDAITGGTWTSGNTAIATAGSSTGIVTGVSAGTAIISYTLGTGCRATAVVTVGLLSSITGTTSVCTGLITTLTDATTGGTWSSGNTAIATVNSTSGTVTGVSAGTVTISYSTGSGCLATTVVTVGSVAAITGTTSACIGLTSTLADATSGGTWSSSNIAVATAGSSTGVITGVSAGTTIITYSLGSGCIATTVFTVTSVAAITGGTFDSVGYTITLSDATSGGTWSSSNTAIATVGSGTGDVGGVAAGTCVITYTIGSGCYATTVVTIVTTSGGGSGGSSAPIVISLSAPLGYPAASLTITGTSFSPIPTGSVVYFGATRATVTTASSTSLGVTVPAEATYMPVSVTTTSVGLTGYSQYPFLPTFDNSAYVAATVNFVPKVDFTAGTNPYSLATGDIDGDGKADIVTANLSANTISVFRNTATSGTITSGSFATKTDFAVGTAPYGITIADIDGDGKLDVITANNSANTVSVLRNTATSGTIGSGSLAAKVDFATGTNPMGVTVNDIDQDGKPDIAVANFYSNTVSLLRNTSTVGAISSGSFAARVDFATGTHPYSVATGDIDGDGKPDIVVPNQGSNTISVLRNTAVAGTITSASLASKIDFTTGAQPYHLAIGDIDGDGKMDVVVANNASNTISVFRNVATSGSITTGSLSTKVDFTTGSAPYNVAIADVDGDGKPDIAVANAGSNTVSILRNTATSGSVTSASLAAKVDYAVGASPRFVALGDLDGDGMPDMAVANLAASSISVLRNNPLQPISGTPIVCIGMTATLTDATNGGTWSSSNTAVAIVGGTGIVTGVATGTATITYSVSGGRTTITATVNATASAITGTAVVCTGGTVALAHSSGGGTWSSSNTAVATAVSGTGVITGVASGSATITYTLVSGCMVTRSLQVNPAVAAITGSTSLCAGTSTTLSNTTTGGTWSSSNAGVASVNGSTGVVAGLSNGSATITYTVACGIATTAVTVGGVPAITAISSQIDTVLASITITGSSFNTTAVNNIVYFGATQATVTSASGTSLTVTVPVDATHAPIAVENTGCSLTAYTQYPFLPTYNNGLYIPTTIAMNAKVDFTAGANPFSIAIGDIDGDGKADMVATNYSSNTISVFRNTSTSGAITSGSFAAKADFTTGSSPYGVAIGDLDRDGKLDIVVTNNTSSPPTVSVFRNTATSGTIGSGSLAAKVDLGVSAGPISVAIADLDMDGKPDIAVANNGANTISLLRNLSAPGSITTTSFAAKADLTTANHPYQVATGDIDGDGKPELIVPNQAAASVSVFRNTATAGSLSGSSFATKVDFTTGSNPFAVAIGDIDGDGKMDIAVANNAANTISVFRNTATSGTIGSGSLATKVDFATGGSPYSVAIGDINGDGKADIVTANSVSNSVSVFRNTATSGTIGSGSLAAKTDFTTGTAPRCVAVGDLDGDYKADIATANISGNNVSVIRNNPTLHPAPTGATGTPVTLCLGSTIVLDGNPAGGIYTSSNTWIAIVDAATGAVTGLAPGRTTVIYATINNTVVTPVVVTPLPDALVITATPGTRIQAGQQVALTATVQNGGTLPVYTWLLNGSPILGATNATYISSNFANNDVVTCTAGSSSGCGDFTVSNSATITVVAEGGSTLVLAASNIRVNPNPNNGTFTITGTLGITTDQEVTLEIVDMLGQIVYKNAVTAKSGRINEQVMLNSNIAHGMYLLNLRSGTEQKLFHFVIGE